MSRPRKPTTSAATVADVSAALLSDGAVSVLVTVALIAALFR